MDPANVAMVVFKLLSSTFVEYEIKEDLEIAHRVQAGRIQTLFFPAGNTIAMPTAQLAEVCRYAHQLFPQLERITVYGSSRYICRKSIAELKELKISQCFLSRGNISFL